MSEAESDKKRLIKFKKPFIFVLVLLVIALLNFGVSGFNAWRAQNHLQKACNLLYSLGNSLDENSEFGTDINTLTSRESTDVTKAAREAIAAQSADDRYRFFRDEVLLFDLNVRGNASTAMENLESPFQIYKFGIYPACTNNVYFYDPDKMAFFPEV